MILPKKKLFLLIAIGVLSLGLVALIFGALIPSLKDTIVNGPNVAKDTSAPIITLAGQENYIISFGESYVEAGFSAIDDTDGDITTSVKIEGSIDTKKYGKQTLIYSATDASGNVGQAKRTVVVQEFTPPELTLIGKSKLYVPMGQEFIEPGFTAVDDVDGDISSQVTTSSDLDINTIGTYTLTYAVTDSSNNPTTRTRFVQVFQPQTEEQITNPPGKVVYLTFDDGPSQYTTLLLDILDKYNVKVTFFVTNQFSAYQDMIGEAHRRGHTIAMHTYSHRFQDIYDSEAAYYEDLNKIRAICEAQTGVTPKIVRFPGGTSNAISKKYCPGIMSRLTQSLGYNGYQYCDWNVDSDDAGGTRTVEGVAANVIAGIQTKDSSVVLQHDTYLYSIEAVEEIICWGLANGYTFLPMTETTPMVHHPTSN